MWIRDTTNFARLFIWLLIQEFYIWPLNIYLPTLQEETWDLDDTYLLDLITGNTDVKTISITLINNHKQQKQHPTLYQVTLNREYTPGPPPPDPLGTPPLPETQFRELAPRMQQT